MFFRLFLTIAPWFAIMPHYMRIEAVNFIEIERGLRALAVKQTQVEIDPEANQRDFSVEDFRMQIIGPGTDTERLHTELGIPQTILRSLLSQFGFKPESILNVVFHQEKPGFIAFQSREIDLKKPSTYISYTRDTDGDMVLGVEGTKDGVNLRGQYKLNTLEKAFKLTAWSNINKMQTLGLEKYAGQENMPIPTQISLRPMPSI